MDRLLEREVVKKQLEMLRFRKTFPAFSFDSDIHVESNENKMVFTWEKNGYVAALHADLKEMQFIISGIDKHGIQTYAMEIGEEIKTC